MHQCCAAGIHAFLYATAHAPTATRGPHAATSKIASEAASAIAANSTDDGSDERVTFVPMSSTGTVVEPGSSTSALGDDSEGAVSLTDAAATSPAASPLALSTSVGARPAPYPVDADDARGLVCVGVDDDAFFRTLFLSVFEYTLHADMSRSSVLGAELTSAREVAASILGIPPQGDEDSDSPAEVEVPTDDLPDVVMLDQNLGKPRGALLLGTTIAAHLVEMAPSFNGVTVILTGSSQEERMALHGAKGVDLIFEKGSRPVHMATQIRALLDAKRAENSCAHRKQEVCSG